MLSTTHNRKSYTGNGVNTTFAYDFLTLDKTHLQVWVDTTLLVLDVDYTVTGIGNQSGGNIVTTVAPASGTIVLILRIVPYKQEAQYPTGDPFPAASHERALDYEMMAIQQSVEELGRSIKVPPTSDLAGSELYFPTGADQIPRMKSDLSGIEGIVIGPADALNVITTKGDIIQGGNTGAAERLAIGATDQVLTVDTTGKVTYLTGPFFRLINKSGEELVAGDVVIQVTDEDNTVNTTATIGSNQSILVAAETIANAATGRFYKEGLFTVNVQGSVARGDFLRTSATAKRAESAGSVYRGGVFGVAVSANVYGGAGTVTALLWGWTVQNVLTIGCWDMPEGLLLSNNTTDANNDIDISAGSCQNSVGQVRMKLASTITKQLDAVWAEGTNAGGFLRRPLQSSTSITVNATAKTFTGAGTFFTRLFQVGDSVYFDNLSSVNRGPWTITAITDTVITASGASGLTDETVATTITLYSKAKSRWYHVELIGKSGGAVDARFVPEQLSYVSEPSAYGGSSAALPSGYTWRRRLLSIKTDASNNIMAFLHLLNEIVNWKEPPDLDIDATIGTTQTTFTLASIPLGTQVQAMVNMVGYNAGTAGVRIYIRHPSITDEAASGITASPLATAGSGHTGSTASYNLTHPILNPNKMAQIRAVGCQAGDVLRLCVTGWIDPRR